jgi:protein involved in polysaccharide export with SLBB domain
MSRPTPFALPLLILATAIALFGASAQAQLRVGEDGLAAGSNLPTSATGISQAVPIARPADTLNSMNRDLGRTGGDAAASAASADDINRALGRARGPARAEPPSQFQRFVQEATGKLLPHFGSQLFNAPQNYVPDGGLPIPADYVLGPGDEIRLQVWGAVDFNATLVLDRNGQVLVPKVGVVPLSGVKVRDLEPVLRASLSKVFTNFSLNANLGRLRSIQIYVVGQALQPGTYVVSSLSTLVNALFASGGPSANGSMRRIQLQRAGKVITQLDLYDFIARGDKSKDVPLMPGDVIVIPPAGPRVAVTGAYDHAAIYELKDANSNVGDVLGLGGGVPAMASAQKALLERVDPLKSPSRQVLDLSLNPAGLQQTLRDGDVLTLMAISPAFTNAVTLQGAVADPVRYRWFDGMKILDLIPERDALVTRDFYRRKNLLVQNEEAGDKPAKTSSEGAAGRVRATADQINWEYAVIERLDRNTLTTQLIPFNLGKVVLQRDPVHNLPLLPGDVVTILNQRDLRLPVDRQVRLVRVEGEVAAPGVYQAAPGETLAQMLRRLGGLTPQAYVYGTEFTRESVRARQQENLELVIRRLEAQSQSQTTTQLSNLSADRASQALALQQEARQQQKSQIDRLKLLKSNGRVSLELDPQSTTLAALPGLPLEDGDRIYVPSTPGFVAAYGAVNNENVFVYKPGKTVGDVGRSAGLMEDADTDQAFVLRADGSIVARRDRSSFMGGNFDSLVLMPGDALVVPTKVDRESTYSYFVRQVKDWTQILSQFGLGAAALKTIR